MKTLTDNGRSGGIFFVSANELVVAHSPAIAPNYYFYLVLYDGDDPIDVKVRKGSDLYEDATLEAQNYRVRLANVG